MKTLRDRLAQFDRAPRARVVTAIAASDPTTQAERLGFRVVAPGHWLREESLALRLDPPAALWPRLREAAQTPELPWLILDTETTGLESGTGTVVFLVAALRIDAQGASLRQHFLSDLLGEASLLRGVLSELQDARLLLSYNGKSFDLPRLRARMALQRLDHDSLELPHLDLVHALRRFAREWLPDLRLATVERELLDIRRVDDVPGALVPELYREWLQCGASTQLEGVLRHNRLDVVHLAALFNRIAAWLRDAPRAEGPPALQLALGRFLELRQAGELAESCYANAAACADAQLRRRARWHSARLLRRRGDDQGARCLWEQLVAEDPSWIAPRVELAKLFEHRLRDLQAARQQTEAALGAQPPARDEQRLRHRLERLLRKQGGTQ